MQDLAYKTILITGGAGGLGSAAVALFIEQGARVVISDLNTHAGTALAAHYGKQAAFVEHDVTDEAAWAHTMDFVAQRFGRLDVLINNAGILQSGNIETATLAQWRQLMQVNADSCFLGCQHGILAMKAHGGSIVNVASVASWMPMQDFPAYGASKAAVASLTRTAALHCRKKGYGIRVNSLHPDGIYTPMMQASAPGITPEQILFDPARNPKGRARMPEDIARLLVFLASDAAQAVSGCALQADNAILGMGLWP